VTRIGAPRIAPLDRSELSLRQAELLAGMSDLNILRTMVRHPGNPARPSTADDDGVLLHAVDELVDAHALSDESWRRLTDRFEERELFELMLLCGQYTLLAGVLNSIGVPPERALPPLGDPE
jgi:hypothetical protein